MDSPVPGPARALLAAGLGAALIAAPGAALAQPQPNTSCYDRGATATFEESRIDTPALPGGVRVPYHLVDVGGFTPLVEKVRRDLCAATSADHAEHLLRQRGTELWRAAVDRAQGRRVMGSIERYDDRPLYWARLMTTRDLRQWVPPFPLDGATRRSLIRTFEYASRGISSTDFPPGPGVARVLVSGFDPYQLNNEIRRSNPSGASALQLDGVVFTVGARTVHIRAVVLPVTWSGFDDEYVEDAFGPHLRPGAPDRADLIMTISQGGRGRMAIEQWAGAWRGGSPDNNNEGTRELIPPAPNWPQPDPMPEFVETTLPHRQLIEAGTGPWPVVLNPRVCEWTDGTRPDPATVSCHDNGPTPGSQASSGGGGNYLSNESMYRSNRLRLGFGLTTLPGGHLHISALVYPRDPLVVIDDAFASDRAATIEQTVALVKAAGAAVS